MSTRKIIKFGKNSYVVTLPHKWIKTNKLSEKDALKFEENGGELVLQAPFIKSEEEIVKRISVDISDSTKRDIERTIVSSYINGFSIIEMRSNNLPSHAPYIRSVVEKIIGLDVVEQTNDKITLQDFLDYNGLNPHDLLRKMDNNIRTLFNDLKHFFNNPSKTAFQEIYSRDIDINKLSYLIYRLVKAGIENPRIKFENLNNLELFYLWNKSRNIEKIGDDIKRAVRIGLKVKDLECKKICVSISDRMSEFFQNVMKASYKKDEDSAIKLAKDKIRLMNYCDEMYDREFKDFYFYQVIERLKNAIASIHIINRATYH